MLTDCNSMMGLVMVSGQKRGKICKEKEQLLFNKFSFTSAVAGEGKRDALSIPHALDLWRHLYMGIGTKLISVPGH